MRYLLLLLPLSLAACDHGGAGASIEGNVMPYVGGVATTGSQIMDAYAPGGYARPAPPKPQPLLVQPPVRCTTWHQRNQSTTQCF